MSTSFDDLNAHIDAAVRLVHSLRVNSDDLRRRGGRSDEEAAMAVDLIRQNMAVAIAVLVRLLDSVDGALLDTELELAGREPVDPDRSPVVPSDELRKAADRLRHSVDQFLREEPTIERVAAQQVDDSR